MRRRLVAMSSYPARNSFAKGKIALAPNNPSAWNYLRGILNHARRSYATQGDFAELYAVDAVQPGVDDVLDLENPPPSKGAELPCSAAIEFMADVHEAKGKEGVSEAVKVCSPCFEPTFVAIQPDVIYC
jgi:protein farnesyltransferase/geranylgeranyltransferase type-1 subunit alpha